MIFHYILFGGSVKNDQLNGIGRAIFDTQRTPGANRSIVGKDAAIALGRRDPLDRVKLRD